MPPWGGRGRPSSCRVCNAPFPDATWLPMRRGRHPTRPKQAEWQSGDYPREIYITRLLLKYLVMQQPPGVDKRFPVRQVHRCEHGLFNCTLMRDPAGEPVWLNLQGLRATDVQIRGRGPDLVIGSRLAIENKPWAKSTKRREQRQQLLEDAREWGWGQYYVLVSYGNAQEDLWAQLAAPQKREPSDTECTVRFQVLLWEEVLVQLDASGLWPCVLGEIKQLGFGEDLSPDDPKDLSPYYEVVRLNPICCAEANVR